MANNNQAEDLEVESYKLSEIFALIPEFEGDQIFLGTFLNACDCAYDMCNQTQRHLLAIHIKNRLRGRAAQLVSSRNPQSYLEIKQLLNLHFGDSRDLSSLIQDLQRLKQLSTESPLTFFNRLQVINAKMQASVQKNINLNADQKKAQCILIETMALNTLLTGLDTRIGTIVRASNPRDLVEAHVRIRRELQLSYFENQKQAKPSFQKPFQQQLKRPFNQPSPRFSQSDRTNFVPQNYSKPFERPNFQQQNSPRPFVNPSYQQQNYSRPFYQSSSPNFQQNRPNFSQNQSRPSVIQQNPNFRPNHRTHCVNTDSPTYDEYYGEYYDQHCESESSEYQNTELQYDLDVNSLNQEQYQDFLNLQNPTQPPDNSNVSNQMDQIQAQIQTMNLDDFNPNVNFPEQKFL